MAGDWIKMRAGLEKSMPFIRVLEKLGVEEANLLALLYRLACWFSEHGKYGKLKAPESVVDYMFRTPGFTSALRNVGWLKVHDDILTLHGFCAVSNARKYLAPKLRRSVLVGAVCAACGDGENLVIDHAVPIVRGGSCERHNLQALCAPCNRRKGRKTMAEFMEARNAK